MVERGNAPSSSVTRTLDLKTSQHLKRFFWPQISFSADGAAARGLVRADRSSPTLTTESTRYQ